MTLNEQIIAQLDGLLIYDKPSENKKKVILKYLNNLLEDSEIIIKDGYSIEVRRDEFFIFYILLEMNLITLRYQEMNLIQNMFEVSPWDLKGIIRNFIVEKFDLGHTDFEVFKI